MIRVMLNDMTVLYGDEGKDGCMNDAILFLRNMILHHRNAVNMKTFRDESAFDKEVYVILFNPIFKFVVINVIFLANVICIAKFAHRYY